MSDVFDLIFGEEDGKRVRDRLKKLEEEKAKLFKNKALFTHNVRESDIMILRIIMDKIVKSSPASDFADFVIDCLECRIRAKSDSEAEIEMLEGYIDKLSRSE